jgi:hypothetical protein
VTDLAKGGFEAWNEAYPGHAGEKTKPLTPASVFLYESVILHGSGVAPSGWQWFDSAGHLAGYLLHVCLPDLAGWWFGGFTFGGPPKRIPLRDTVGWATEADQEDKAFFRAFPDHLETLLARPDSVDFEAVSALLERFTGRLGNTPQGSLTLLAYPDALSAGTQLLEDYEELEDPATGSPFENSEWLDLCARAGTDPAASEVVARVFENAHTV